jgi:hypothetical protein
MKTWLILVAAISCFGFSGCFPDQNAFLRERELRLQEDQIYQLKEAMDDQRAVIDSCRRENDALRRLVASTGEPSDALGGGISSKSGGAAKSSSTGDTMLLVPPKVELPATQPPAVRLPESHKSAARSLPPSTLPISGPVLPGTSNSDDSGDSLTGLKPHVIQGESRQVAKIAINPLVTGGYNTSGKTGHDGVMVCIEPRDAKGQLIEAPADVSVVVLDPALQGQAARIARWDFSAKEIASRFERTPIAPGIQLEMPWPSDPPSHNDLRVFVRYTTADGRKLEADKSFKVALAGEPVSRASISEATLPAEPAGPVLQTVRANDSWRASQSAPLRVEDKPSPRLASRLNDAAPSRTADAPIAETAGLPDRPNRTGDAKTQRPVWSPNR